MDGHRGLGRCLFHPGEWAPGASVLPTLLVAPSLAGLSPDWQGRGRRPLLDLEVGSRALDLCLFWLWGGEEGGREGEGGSQGPILLYAGSLASFPSADIWSQPAAAPPGAQRLPCTRVPPCLCELWLVVVVVVPFVEPVYTLFWPSPAVSVSPVSQVRALLSRCDILDVKTCSLPFLRLSLETVHFK